MTAPATGAGLLDYLKAAFLFRWNLLLFLGATAAAAISPLRDALLPLIGAAEVAYLAGLSAAPRFRSAIDARAYADRRAAAAALQPADGRQSLEALLAELDTAARQRFERLRERCLQMHAIASGVGGRTGEQRRAAEDLHAPGLDRLLWVFLRLLYSQASLARFLSATDGKHIEQVLQATRQRLTEAEGGGDERLLRSLRDTLATQEVRLDNYQKARGNAEFVAVEIDRLEGKIQALSEMAVNRQDPDFISREVDSVAASMHHTEAAISEISLVDGLIEDLGEPPPILRSDREVKEIG
jgi:hypothetical protein